MICTYIVATISPLYVQACVSFTEKTHQQKASLVAGKQVNRTATFLNVLKLDHHIPYAICHMPK